MFCIVLPSQWCSIVMEKHHCHLFLLADDYAYEFFTYLSHIIRGCDTVDVAEPLYPKDRPLMQIMQIRSVHQE